MFFVVIIIIIIEEFKMQQESINSNGFPRDPNLPCNNVDQSTKLSQNEPNQQPIKTVAPNYVIHDNIVQDENMQESRSKMNIDSYKNYNNCCQT